MNVRFRRLNKKSEIRTAPVLQLPHPVIVDDWLKRERQRRQRENEEKRPQIRLPKEMPQKAPEEEPGEIRIDINNPDNSVN